MTKRRVESEQLKFNALKVARTAIRLRHSLEADNELNEVLPGLEAKIDEFEANGEAWVLDPVTLEIEAG